MAHFSPCTKTAQEKQGARRMHKQCSARGLSVALVSDPLGRDPLLPQASLRSRQQQHSAHCALGTCPQASWAARVLLACCCLSPAAPFASSDYAGGGAARRPPAAARRPARQKETHSTAATAAAAQPSPPQRTQRTAQPNTTQPSPAACSPQSATRPRLHPGQSAAPAGRAGGAGEAHLCDVAAAVERVLVLRAVRVDAPEEQRVALARRHLRARWMAWGEGAGAAVGL
jgi:hypothetical protein